MDRGDSKKNKFKVIKGGWLPPQSRKRIFHSAIITNTRLMGNMGLAVFWSLENWDEDKLLFQYFNLDTDAQAFESFEQVWDQSPSGEIPTRYIETTMSCLGGSKVDLTEREVRYLIRKYFSEKPIVSTNVENIREELAFILNEPLELSSAEKKALNKKIYVPIKGDYDRINYFLMRYFSGDTEPLPYLASRRCIQEGIIDLTLFDELTGSTMHRNQSTKLQSSDEYSDSEPASNIRRYKCTTILENNSGYFLVISIVTLQSNIIVDFEKVSVSKISETEVAFAMRRKEFISVYQPVNVIEDNVFSIRLPSATVVKEVAKGTIFLVFRENNDHVAENPFLLNNDLEGIVFFAYFGEIILAAYRLEDIQNLEETFEIHNSSFSPMVEKRFQFQNPILLDFINSPIEYFYDFIDAITNDEGDDDGDDDD